MGLGIKCIPSLSLSINLEDKKADLVSKLSFKIPRKLLRSIKKNEPGISRKRPGDL